MGGRVNDAPERVHGRFKRYAVINALMVYVFFLVQHTHAVEPCDRCFRTAPPQYISFGDEPIRLLACPWRRILFEPRHIV